MSESLKGYESYLCASSLLKIKSEVPQEDFVVVEEEIGYVVPTALLESQAKSCPLSLVLLQLLLHCVVKLFLFNILGCLCSYTVTMDPGTVPPWRKSLSEIVPRNSSGVSIDLSPVPRQLGGSCAAAEVSTSGWRGPELSAANWPRCSPLSA